MEQGKIVEQGKHEELLHLGGIYTQLWNIQTGQRSKSRQIPIVATQTALGDPQGLSFWRSHRACGIST
jgi:hypothetical protein